MTLYIVATPIGNLGDVTFRAVEILKRVDVVFCEDTRITKRLFERYEIETPMESINAHTESKRSERVLKWLRDEKDVALVSDAGTPSVSDPGSLVVSRVRESLPHVAICPIPGPSALTAALSVSGFASSECIFYGFLPHKKGRQTALREIAASARTSIMLESPHRIEKLLKELTSKLAEDRRVCIARELTKTFEETRVGTATQLHTYLVDNPDKIRGEFVVIIEGA